jgi:energy-coupling factor transporter ATP-binding protein EcfA2
MNSTAYEELFQLLTAAGDLTDPDRELVLAAAEGAASLSALLAGDVSPATPSPESADAGVASAPLAYLEEIAVEGFRGVGQRARLPLQPGPGLTLVVGRNGSGKSSFAEGLEVLLTGTTWRWEEKAKVWREGWRNLHHDGAVTVSARVRVDGGNEPIQLTRNWAAGAALDSVTATRVSGAVSSWSELDWDRPLEQFRPILSYNELGTMFSSHAAALYDALSAILGLEEFDAVQATLREERLAREKTGKQEKTSRTALAQQLAASEDARAEDVGALLSGRTPKVDDVAAFITAPDEHGIGPGLKALATLNLPERDTITEAVAEVERTRAAVRALKQTDAAQIDALASVLEAGLAFHEHAGEDPTDCPLCGTAGVIDAGWAIRTEAAAQELRRKSQGLRVAEGEARQATATLTRIFDPATSASLAAALATDGLDLAKAAAAREAWTAATAELATESNLALVAERGIELLEALTALGTAAKELVEARTSAWRPLVEAIAAWVQIARRAAKDRATVERLKRGEAWMGTALTELRSKRLAPIVDGARANWDLLRHESNVALGDIGLRKQGSIRYAAFDVTIDRSNASALGVMSQGELSALAICIFLPRALLQGSPFGFVVIDDPVQSMDPAKVDGLARVLADTAKKRQVVVFTHDERLPEAIRRLDIDARVMRVQRRAKSQLEITAGRPPSERYLDEAFSLSKGEHLPPEVIRAVVPAFCRSAIEAACAERIRRERVSAGISHAAVDDELAQLTTVNSWLRTALGLSQAQGKELRQKVINLGGEGAWTAVALARSGAHESIGDLDPVELAGDTKKLVSALERR